MGGYLALRWRPRPSRRSPRHQACGECTTILYTDAQIADLITAALALDERTTWEAIDVVYEGGTAALRGIVTSVEARVAAEEIAQHALLVWHTV